MGQIYAIARACPFLGKKWNTFFNLISERKKKSKPSRKEWRQSGVQF